MAGGQGWDSGPGWGWGGGGVPSQSGPVWFPNQRIREQLDSSDTWKDKWSLLPGEGISSPANQRSGLRFLASSRGRRFGRGGLGNSP